jgi:hypothetical protein
VSVFACVSCGAALTPRLTFAAPSTEPESATVDPGGFFVDPEPRSRTYDGRTGALIDVASTHCIVVNPTDVVDARWHRDDGSWSGCCGPGDDPRENLLCGHCGSPIGTLLADCYTSFEVRLEPARVTRTSDARAVHPRGDHPAWFSTLRDLPLDDRLAQLAESPEPDRDTEALDADETPHSQLFGWRLYLGRGRIFLPASNAPVIAVVDAETLTVESVIELPNVEVGVARRPPRWGTPSAAATPRDLWVTDVVDSGIFAIDLATLQVRGRVAIEGRDQRTPDSSPATTVAAADTLVVTTGAHQGDVAVVEPRGLQVQRFIRAGRSLGALAGSGASAWVVDDADDTLHRLDLVGGATSKAIHLDGSADEIRVGLGFVWISASTNTLPGSGRLHRIDPETAAVDASLRLNFPAEAICLSDSAVWLAGAAPYGHTDENTVTMDGASDPREESWENTTLLTCLDPATLEVVRTTTLEGQIQDLAWDGRQLWATAFSIHDQAERLLCIEPATGLEARRLSLAGLDVSRYNPPVPAPTTRLPTTYNDRVRELVATTLATDPLRNVTVSLQADDDRGSLALVEQDENGATWFWRCPLRSLHEPELADEPEPLAQIILATFEMLRGARPTSPDDGRPQQLD